MDSIFVSQTKGREFDSPWGYVAKKCELCGGDGPLKGKPVKDGNNLSKIKMLCSKCHKG